MSACNHEGFACPPGCPGAVDAEHVVLTNAVVDLGYAVIQQESIPIVLHEQGMSFSLPDGTLVRLPIPTVMKITMFGLGYLGACRGDV